MTETARAAVPRRLIALITLGLMLAAVAARLIPGPRTIDDAFITFRYARNIVEGAGFVYNPGVATLGTTTPLFALLLAGASAATGSGDFPALAVALSAAADAVGVALLFTLGRRALPIGVAALPALLWAVSPMSVTFAIGGMETSLAVLWMLAAFTAFTAPPSARNDAVVGVCIGLGLLTRIDSALWAASLLGWQALSRLWAARARLSLGALPLATWGAVALVLLPWAIYATAAFGSPIPNSVTAKRDAYLVPAGSALVRMVQTYSTPFFEFDTFGSAGAMAGALITLVLALVSLLLARRAAPRLIPLLLYPWGYAAVFALLNPLIFRWYMAPPLPALMLAIVIGLWALVGRLPKPAPALLAGGAAAVWLFTSLNAWVLAPDHGPARPAPEMAWHALELEYQRMAETLVADFGVTPQTRVASGDIGAVGYFSRAVIVDTVGLVTPELTRYYPVDPALVASDQNYAIPPQLIYDTAPEFLVTMEGFIRAGLAQEARFADEYTLVRVQPFPFYGAGMHLYQRQADS